jgi:hypothetical protein
MAAPARATVRPATQPAPAPVTLPALRPEEALELIVAINQLTAVQLAKLALIEQRGRRHPSVPGLRRDIAEIDGDIARAEAVLARR